MRLEGVFVANVTPFSADGKLDLNRLHTHLEWLAQSGVQGFVPCATTGETSVLNSEERSYIIQLSVEIAHRYEIKVIAGCGSNCTETALHQLELAAELGCHSGLIVTPYYNKPTLQGVRAHFEYLAEKSPIPIVLYNIPSRTNIAIPWGLALELLSHPKIIGIKESSGNHAQFLSLACRMPLQEKALLAGDDDAFATILALGGSGIISASANVLPREFVQIYQSAKEGNLKAAFEKQKRIHAFIEALFLETNPAPIKFVLACMGRVEGKLRLPLLEVSDNTANRIRMLLKEFELV